MRERQDVLVRLDAHEPCLQLQKLIMANVFAALV